MASLQEIHASNAQIASTFSGLVGLFIGATSGIGAGTLKAFAKYTSRPRAYFVGRSQNAADAIIEECKKLNPEGEYIFIRGDVSLIKVVDEVCNQIKAKESALNILFLSQGVVSLDRSLTSEGLHLLTALCYYSRIRFIKNLLPLIENTNSLRRIVTVGAAGFEGPVDSSDFPALHVPPEHLRGHVASLITLGLEAVSCHAPSATFIHSYPGAVDTPLTRQLLTMGQDVPLEVPVPEDWLSAEESGERHLFLLTSARYPSATRVDSTISVESALDTVCGVDGRTGNGVYAVQADGASVSLEAIEFLAGLRKDGLVEKLCEHTEQEFQRIISTGDC